MEYGQPENDPKSELDILLSIKSLSGLDNQEAFNLIGKMIDLADALDNLAGANRALELCDELADSSLNEGEDALLHYFRANAWAIHHKCKTKDPNAAWAWDQSELLRELFHLRSALRHAGFTDLDKVRRCQILTNTANLLNKIGRCTEAVEYWNRALEIIPSFGMALGNRGNGLMSYARLLYDHGHAVAMIKVAHDDLRLAASDEAFFEFPDHGDVKEVMGQKADEIAAHIDIGKVASTLDLNNHSLGRSKKERAYRMWCLEQRLFLTPLNDLGAYPIAASDTLMLPNLVVEVGEPPTLIGFFNQLKQEYVASRYLYYESIREDSSHFADRDVLLYDTLDYPAYSLAVERVKAAYRIAYSVFDKLAFFINAYWQLGMKERAISFRSIWCTKQSKGRPAALKECFCGYENLPLRGLFWLSKDLLENDIELADTMEPDAEALSTIRNHLEHKYLKVHDWPWTTENYSDSIHDSLRDSLAYSMTRKDLEAKALRLLKLARAGLIYLSLAVHREEQLREEQRGDGLVMPMELNTWPDDWKR